MINKIKNKTYNLLRWSEKYAKTDMVYLAKSTFWINSNTTVVSIFSFLLYMAFSKFLPKENYGFYQFILSIGSIIGAFTLTGMNTAITQAVARGFEGTFKKSIIIQLKYSIVPFLISLGVSLYYILNNNWEIAFGVLIVGILIPIINTFNTCAAFLNGRKDFKSNFFLSQILNFTYYPILIFSLLITKNPLILVFLNLILNLLAGAISYFIIIKTHKPNNQEDPETVSYGKHLSLANFIGTAIMQLDNILVFHYFGAIELAIYAFATNIADRFSGLFKSIQIAAFPKIAVRDKDDLKNNLIIKSIKLFLLNIVFILIYIILAPYIYKIFFPEYVSSIFYSQLYAVMLALSAIYTLPLITISAKKEKKEYYIYSIISPLFSIISMIIMIKYFGIFGLIINKGVSNIFNAGLSYKLVFKK